MDGACKTFDERQDYVKFSANACKYSGKGINPGEQGEVCSFAVTRSDKCGPQNDYAQCSPGMFCNNNGQCGYDQSFATPGENCNLYSGQGIKDCKRKDTTNNKCGPQNDHRRCIPGKYCTEQGLCTSDIKDMSTNCMRYSGEGIVSCALSPNIFTKGNSTNNVNTNIGINNNGPSSNVFNGKCGVNKESCPPYQFCNDNGKCSYQPSIKSKKYCLSYSGANINNCKSQVNIISNKDFNRNVQGTNTVNTTVQSLEECITKYMSDETWETFIFDGKICTLSTIPPNIARARQRNKKNTVYGYINSS